MISPSFARLAVTIQDSCYNVRIAFLFKLLSLLQPRKLPPRFNVIPFLTVHDPEADVKSTVSGGSVSFFLSWGLGTRENKSEAELPMLILCGCVP